MAESVSGSGVTINSVLPGPTLTQGFRDFVAQDGITGDEAVARAGREFVATQRPTSLLGRLATPEEVANMVVYVASEQASATTGTALRVDGGVIRAIP